MANNPAPHPTPGAISRLCAPFQILGVYKTKSNMVIEVNFRSSFKLPSKNFAYVLNTRIRLIEPTFEYWHKVWASIVLSAQQKASVVIQKNSRRNEPMWRGSGFRVSPQIPLWNLAIGDNTGVTKSRFIVIFSLTADAAKPGSSLLSDHRSRKMWNREQRAAISPTVPLLLPGAQKFIWFENLNTFSSAWLSQLDCLRCRNSS